jgi:hypothetical protein
MFLLEHAANRIFVDKTSKTPVSNFTEPSPVHKTPAPSRKSLAGTPLKEFEFWGEKR